MPRQNPDRLAVEQVLDYAIFVVDLRGRIASWNAGVKHVLGWSEHEWIGQPASIVFTPEDVAGGALEAELEQARTTGRADDDRWQRRKDGSRFWATGVTTALRDEQGEVTGFLKMMRDSTERKLAEDRRATHLAVTTVLAEAPELRDAVPTLLRAICSASGWRWGALWEVEPSARALRLVSCWHEPSEPMTELDEASARTRFERGVGLPGRTWATASPHWITDTFHDENFPRRDVAARAGLRGALCFPVSWRGEVHAVMEFFSGEIRPPDPALLGTMAVAAGQIGQFIDRKQTADRLRASEARHAAGVEAALDCIVSMDAAGKVTEWNPAAERTFGYSRDEALDREMAELIIPPSLRDAHRRGLARYLATGEAKVLSRRFEISAVRSDGSELSVELTIIRLPAEEPPAFTAFIRDISEQKRTDEALRMSERRAQRLIEQSPLSIQIFAPDGTVRQVNRAWERLWGLTLAQMPDYNIRTDPQLAAHGMTAPLEQAFAGGAATIEPFPYRPDRGEFAGQVRYCGAYVYAIKDEVGHIEEVVLVHDDVTDRKRAEDALGRAKAESERNLAQWQAVFENITEGLVLADPDGNLVSMNPAALAIHGFGSMADVLTQVSDYPDLFELHDSGGRLLERHEWPISRVLRGERFAGYEVRVRRRDTARSFVGSYGGTPVIGGDGRLALAVLTLRDVTERHRAAAALAESEAKFRQLAETMPQLAWTAHRDGHISWYNRRWYDYTGTTAEAMEGWGWQSVHDPAVLPAVLERWRRSIETGETFELEFPLRGADGIFRPFLTRVAPLRDAEGRVVQWFGTNTDVTEQRRAAEEREHLLASERAARAEAEHASTMKDEFLATLSHELRTPLNAILGWSQVLTFGERSSEELRDGLRTIERNARAQAQIIEDLLDMSRIISGKVRLDVQRVELPALIRTAIQTIEPAAEAKGVRVHAVLDPRAGPVSGDPARLQQVLWNLLSNAVKFTPKGGRVQVLLERINSHVEISVIDTGAGIEPEFLPFAFDRFRQADASTTRTHGGLGIGLSLVKQLVELHGGSVRGASPGAGQGSTFTIALPLTVVHAEPAPELERRHPSTAASAAVLDPCVDMAGIRVLVVDDEPDARALVKRILEECSARVSTAKSAAEAITLVQTEVPDVLVCDIGMPGEDGYSLIQRIRGLPSPTGRVPALALSAYARPEDRVRAVRAGFQMHVAKPVEPAELIAMVASLARK
ncbi:MAG: PAS domain S-box protein [Myxococcota bacterium]|nr:PAS domain S-box protein [Myxococcota bacterium]